MRRQAVLLMEPRPLPHDKWRRPCRSKGPFKWEGGTTPTYVANVKSTSNLIGHLEEMSETCQAQAAALNAVRENSKGYCQTAAGEYVQKCTEGVFLRDEH